MKRIAKLVLTVLAGLASGSLLPGCACTRIERLSGPDFVARADQIKQVSSFHWTTYIGRSRQRAYLESGHPAFVGRGARTTVYWTPLSELPKDMADHLRAGNPPWKLRGADTHMTGSTIESTSVAGVAVDGEDVAFFEATYGKKLTGIKPIGEYSDPDQFHSAIAQQLGIPQKAWAAAAEKFGWTPDGGMAPKAIVKRATGRWQILIIRFSIDPDTRKPDPATLQTTMVELDDDGRATFPDTVDRGTPGSE